MLSAWVGESPSGMRRPRPPVENSVTGVGYETDRMYWLSRFASPESLTEVWLLRPPWYWMTVNCYSVSGVVLWGKRGFTF